MTIHKVDFQRQEMTDDEKVEAVRQLKELISLIKQGQIAAYAYAAVSADFVYNNGAGINNSPYALVGALERTSATILWNEIFEDGD